MARCLQKFSIKNLSILTPDCKFSTDLQKISVAVNMEKLESIISDVVLMVELIAVVRADTIRI